MVEGERNVDWNGIERATIDRGHLVGKSTFAASITKRLPSLAPLDWILLSKCLFPSFWPIGKLIERKKGREELLRTVISWQGMHVCVVAVGRRSVFHSISSACLFFFFLTNMLLTIEQIARDRGGRTGHQRNWKLPFPPSQGNVPLNSRPFSGETWGKRSHVCSYARLNRWLSYRSSKGGTRKSNWFYMGTTLGSDCPI